MLYVKIIDLITGIKSQDWLSASDLFVEIEFEKSKRRTNIVWNDNIILRDSSIRLYLSCCDSFTNVCGLYLLENCPVL